MIYKSVKFRCMSILLFSPFSLLRCDYRFRNFRYWDVIGDHLYILQNATLKCLLAWGPLLSENVSKFYLCIWRGMQWVITLNIFPIIPKFCSLNFESYAFWKLTKHVHIHFPVFDVFFDNIKSANIWSVVLQFRLKPDSSRHLHVRS